MCINLIQDLYHITNNTTRYLCENDSYGRERERVNIFPSKIMDGHAINVEITALFTLSFTVSIHLSLSLPEQNLPNVMKASANETNVESIYKAPAAAAVAHFR